MVFLFLSILEKPFFLIQPVSVTIGRGQTAKFDCKVTGGKGPKISWYFNKEMYDEMSNEKGILVDENNSLIISNTDDIVSKGVICIFKDSFRQEQQPQKYSIRASLHIIGK